MNRKKCLYCAQADDCEHHLLTVNVTFYEVLSGFAFEWGEECLFKGIDWDDEELDIQEEVLGLMDGVDNAADYSMAYEVEYGPGDCCELYRFYCSTSERVKEAARSLKESWD